LIARVQALPPETIILFIRQFIGRHGESIANDDGLKEVLRAARVPIYVGAGALIGSGAVGGVVLDIEKEARQLATLALNIAAHGPPQKPAIESELTPVFDWRQLRRWNIDERLLPAHSEVRFRQLGLWNQYRWYIVGVLSVCLIQSTSIVGLLLQRRRRRRAEVALQASESALRASVHEVQTLARRLIASQEVERTRIARELHDDISQKLALLSIDLSRIVTDAGRSDHVMNRAREASIRTGEIISDVRTLSHELHPARLEMLGLEAAMRGLCAEMSSMHHIEIDFEYRPIALSVPADTALCLFRVTQEALRNVVKHSLAEMAAVSLRDVDDILELRIADSGRGFLPEAEIKGLGLVSMRERVAGIGGVLVVQSTPGQGTIVEVSVSLREGRRTTHADLDYGARAVIAN
jgi:signal transduction histidine kinase